MTRRLHEEGVKVVYDSGWSDDLSIDGIKAFLPYIDVYTPNDKEARKLAGTDDLEEAVRFLAGYTPHPVVTLGKGGCAYWHDGSIRYVSAIDEFRAVDTTGAGDNFLTGIIYGLLTEEPLDRCVRLGNIFAGKSTTAVGCFGAAVTPALIRKYLWRAGEDTAVRIQPDRLEETLRPRWTTTAPSYGERQMADQPPLRPGPDGGRGRRGGDFGPGLLCGLFTGGGRQRHCSHQYRPGPGARSREEIRSGCHQRYFRACRATGV